MDKYTYNLKTEKILKLVRQEDYITAAKIADTLDWKQVHNIRLLNAVAEAYENTRQYAEAIDVLLTAYEQASIGKRIMYKLTELAVAANSLADAETFYQKYLEEAPDENNRFILRYMIAEAKGEDLDKRITILETYKKYEFEEEWACRLAELYQRAGREKECVALCDEIILWFGFGPYVERAMELKEIYEPLTDSQKDRRENRAFYEARVRELAKEMEQPDDRTDSESGESTPEGAEEDELPVIAISEEVAAARLDDVEESSDLSEPASEAPVEEKEEDAWSALMSNVRAADQNASRIEESLSAAESVEASAAEYEGGSEEEEPSVEPEPVKEEGTLELSEELEEESEPVEEPDMGEVDLPLADSEEVISGLAEAAATIADEPVEETLNSEKEEPAGVLPEETPEAENKEDLEKTKELEIPVRIESEDSSVEVDEEPTKRIILPPELQEEEAAPTEDGSVFERPEREEIPLATSRSEEPAAEKIPLASDSTVLPVLSFDETEKAVWEDQNRRLEEIAPIESHEMEHCIFVSAASSAEGIDKAVEALEEHYQSKNQELPRIAKILAERLNYRGLIRSLPQLNQKDLIIDEANNLSDELIGELLEILDYLDTEKVFVLVDTPAAIAELTQRVRARIIESEHDHRTPDNTAAEELPSIQMSETEEEPEAKTEKAEEPVKPRKVVKVEKPLSFENIDKNQELSERDFVRYADYYANELECVIDDSGFEALKEEIEAIRKEGGRLTAGEVEEILEDAAEHADKMTIMRLFSAKYDKEGYLILRERDFL